MLMFMTRTLRAECLKPFFVTFCREKLEVSEIFFLDVFLTIFCYLPSFYAVKTPEVSERSPGVQCCRLRGLWIWVGKSPGAGRCGGEDLGLVEPLPALHRAVWSAEHRPLRPRGGGKRPAAFGARLSEGWRLQLYAHPGAGLREVGGLIM